MAELAARFPEMINELKSDNDLVLLSRFVEGGGDNRIFIRTFCSKQQKKLSFGGLDCLW